MAQVVKYVVLTGASLLLGSCSHWFGNDSYFHNTNSAYLTSTNGRDIVVPPPLTRQYITNFYHVPEQTKNAEISIKPPAMQTEVVQSHYVPAINAAAIKTVDGGLMIAKPIAQTWSIVGSALKRKSIGVVKVDGSRFIYYIGKGNQVSHRINLFARGNFDTLMTITDVNGKSLSAQQYTSLRNNIVNGMQGKSNYSISSWWR